MSQNRIREWYDHWNGDVCISFSGGKDSTVLAHLVHDLYPDVPMVFSNTGLEYPEIQAFARKMGAEFIRPKMSFSEVISKYGYPIISKENAEAIYYARKIRNSEGGVQRLYTTETRSTAFDATHNRSTGKTAREICMGGYETIRRRADITGTREHISRPDGLEKGNAHRKTAGGGYIPQTTRMRTQLRGEYGWIRTGVEPTGGNGEGTPLPG